MKQLSVFFTVIACCIFAGCSFIRDFEDFQLQDGGVTVDQTTDADADLPECDLTIDKATVSVTDETFTLILSVPVALPQDVLSVSIEGIAIDATRVDVDGSEVTLRAIPMDARHFWKEATVRLEFDGGVCTGNVEFVGAPRTFLFETIAEFSPNLDAETPRTIRNMEVGDLNEDGRLDILSVFSETQNSTDNILDEGELVALTQDASGFTSERLNGALGDSRALGVKRVGLNIVEIRVGSGENVLVYQANNGWDLTRTITPLISSAVNTNYVLGIHHGGGDSWIHLLRSQINFFSPPMEDFGAVYLDDGTYLISDTFANNAGAIVKGPEKSYLAVPLEECVECDPTAPITEPFGFLFYELSRPGGVIRIRFDGKNISMTGSGDTIYATSRGDTPKVVEANPSSGPTVTETHEHLTGSLDIETIALAEPEAPTLVVCGATSEGTLFDIIYGVDDAKRFSRDLHSCASLAVGDMDGDGLEDIVIGSRNISNLLSVVIAYNRSTIP